MRKLILLLLVGSCFGRDPVIVKRRVSSASPAGFSVTKVGTYQGSALSGAPAYSISLTGNVAAGHNLILAFSSSNASIATFSVSDSRSNVCQTDVSQLWGAGGVSVLVASCRIATGLTAGVDTIYVSCDQTANWNALIYDVTGLSAASWMDQAAGNNTPWGATPTSSSLTPSVSPSLAFAACVTDSNWSAYGSIIASAATGLDHTTASGGQILMTEWRTLSANTAGTADFSLSGDGDNVMAFVVYK
jgi:hypothetical protein